MKFEIIVKSNQAKLNGPVDAELESKLQTEFHWTSELDFSVEKLFYAENLMYSGVIYAVKEFIENLGHEVELVIPALPEPRYDWPFTWEYRPRQKELADIAIEKRYGVLEAPPGTGKTGIAISIICQIGQPAAIFVSEIEPFNQAYEALCKIIDPKYIGRVGNGIYEPSVINVCMVQSTVQLIKKGDPFISFLKNETHVFICDECHGFVGSMAWDIFDLFRNCFAIIGISATPTPEHGRSSFVQALIGKIHASITYAEMIDAQVLCPVTFYIEKMRVQNYQINPKDSQRKRAEKYRQIVDECIVYNKERHNHIKQFVDEMLEDNISVAVICQQVEHAKSLLEVIPYATLLTGTTKKKEREDIVKKLRNKEIMCVITTVFNQAVDIPSLGAVAIVAGGKSYVKLIQRIRSTRTFSGETATGHLTKREGIVYYPYDRAPFLQNHSSQALKIFKEFCSGHKLNKIIEVN